MNPELSVVVPVYNVERYIKTCLESILNNGLDQSRFEIVVVDDESPDQSMREVERLAAQNPGIRMVRQKNTGISGARNAGIKQASGTFILFVDSDDWLEAGALEQMLDMARSENLDVLEFGIRKVTNDGAQKGTFSTSSQGAVYSGIAYYNRVRYVNSVFNKLYRKSLLDESKIRFIEKIYVEDFEFNTRVFLEAKRVKAIPDLWYQYRQSPNSITRTKDQDRKRKMIHDHIVVLEATSTLWKQGGSDERLSFLGERMSFLVVSVFYLMLKSKHTYSELKAMRAELEKKGIYEISYPIHQKNKDLFRKMMVKNFALLALVQKVSNNLIS